MDVHHFVIEESRHLVNGCTTKCGCIGLMLFCNISCLDTIICNKMLQDLFWYMPADCDTLVTSCATLHLPSMKQNGRLKLNGRVT